MFFVYTEVMAQDEIKPRLIFSFFLCLRLTSPIYAFMRCRLYSNQKTHIIHYCYFYTSVYLEHISFVKVKVSIFLRFYEVTFCL